MQLLEPGGVTGQGRSTTSGTTAKDAAWTDVCAQLEQSLGLDCHDSSRIAVRSERSSSIAVKKGDGAIEQRYEHTVTLVQQRHATGSGDAEHRDDACRYARQQACMKLVAGPCPADDIRVVEIDGPPPKPAPAQPPTPSTPGPTTL